MPYAEVTVKVAGKDLAEDRIRAGNIVLRQALAEHHSFEMDCLHLVRDGGDARQGESEALDALLSALGQSLEIEARWEGSGAEEGVRFAGVVTDVQATRSLDGGYAVRLQGYSGTIVLDALPRNRIWEKKTVTEILSEIAGDYDDVCEVSTGCPTMRAYTVQREETDFAFLRRICQAEQIWAWYDGERFRIADQIEGDGHTLTLGRDEVTGILYRFGLRARVEPSGHRIRAFNPLADELYQKGAWEFAVNGDIPPFSETALRESDRLYARHGHLEPQFPPAALADVDGELERLRYSWAGGLVIGEGESDKVDLKPGDELTLSGLSADQNGTYLIHEVTHHIQGSGGEYRNVFSCVPSSMARPRIEARRGDRNELWSAQVVEGHSPDQPAMVRVQYNHPVDGNTESGQTDGGDAVTTWARVASPHAGKGWGSYWIPEVGDEVVVGHLNADMQQPVVLGSVYTKHESAAIDAVKDEVEQNEGKVILTKSGNRILFRDTADKETIEITTPDGRNRITMTMDGGATIELSTEGKINVLAEETVSIDAQGDISVSTAGSMSVETDGDFSVKAKGKASIESEQEVEIKGPVVKIEADGSNLVNIQTGAGVKVNGTIVDVKGSMIKLN